MIALRRSPRTLLARDGYPGPGPGKVAVVMARAGVGKTAFLVGIGLDALLSGQRVLHIALGRPVGKVRGWYDDLLAEMLQREKQLQHLAAIQLEMERRRHIHTYLRSSFTVEKLRQALSLLIETMDFRPQVILFDILELESLERETFEQLRTLAGDLGAELWITCRTHRDGPQAAPGHLPPPADRFEDLIDLGFHLAPQDTRIRLQVLKDRDRILDLDLKVLLDPQSLLLTTGVGARK